MAVSYKLIFVVTICSISGIALCGGPLNSLVQAPFWEALTENNKFIPNLSNAAKLYFKGTPEYYDPHWQAGIQESDEDKNRQKQLFGYHLQLEHIVDSTPGVQLADRHPTLYFHGWSEFKNSAKIFKKYMHVLPGEIVTFNFPDVPNKANYWRKSSFGQLPDVLPAIYALKWVKDNLNPEAIDLYGVSRGGATVCNMIAVLHDSSGAYKQYFDALGINDLERAELLSLIENGCIVLDVPLRNMNTVISERLKFFKSKLPHMAVSKMTKYDPNGIQGITSVGKLENLKLNVLIHFQHRDTIVTNLEEAEFYNNFANHNHHATYLVLGNDGGHIHNHKSLAKTVHTFKKIHGGSYEIARDEQYVKEFGNHNPCREGLLMQPGITNSADCIKQFHLFCRQKRR